MARPPSLRLPVEIADEIAAAAARAERSITFLLLGALRAAGPLTGKPPGGPRRDLTITVDEDDPRDAATRVKKLVADKAGAATSVADAVALAWAARREQILAWVERVAAVDVAQQADDLDDGLRAAADPATSADRLLALARSAYPRVRALVAAHPSAPTSALELLGQDRERVVREALERRG